MEFCNLSILEAVIMLPVDKKAVILLTKQTNKEKDNWENSVGMYPMFNYFKALF